MQEHQGKIKQPGHTAQAVSTRWRFLVWDSCKLPYTRVFPWRQKVCRSIRAGVNVLIGRHARTTPITGCREQW